MRHYLEFVVQERRLLSFGFTFTFFSNFGQTFLISLFVPFFLDTFSMSNTSFGSLFSLATLVSALMLPYLGNHIDRQPLKRFSIMVAMGLMLATFTVSIAWNIGILFAGLLMLRLAGQGLSAHTAQTAMTKFFDFQRGKAISISELGYPLGEASLTLALTALLPLISWRAAWAGTSIIIGVLLIPFVLGILRGDMEKQTSPQSTDSGNMSQSRVWKMMLKDRQFYLHLPAVIMPPFWATSLFLYQFSIGEELAWSAPLIASAFLALASSRIASSLIIGPLVDRLGAKALFPYHLLPFAGGLFIAYLNPGTWAAFAYMFLLGITLGMGGNITASLWVDMYGKKCVGSVKSIFSCIMIVCSSLSPFILGYLIDSPLPVSQILLSAVISMVMASILAYLAFRKEPSGEVQGSTSPVRASNREPAVITPPELWSVPDPTAPVLSFREEILPTEAVVAQHSWREPEFH